ncbi:hypothetical protein [Acinetobacter sp. AS5]
MNRYTALCSHVEGENLPLCAQFRVLKYIFGVHGLSALKNYKEVEHIDEAFLKKHFLRMMNYDFEAVIYLAMVGMRELILEADAFDHDGEQNTQNELKQAFQYVSENDVRNFAYVTHMGYSEKYFNWNIIRHQSKDEADNPLTFWLFKNAMYSLFFNLANRE